MKSIALIAAHEGGMFTEIKSVLKQKNLIDLSEYTTIYPGQTAPTTQAQLLIVYDSGKFGKSLQGLLTELIANNPSVKVLIIHDGVKLGLKIEKHWRISTLRKQSPKEAWTNLANLIHELAA